MQALDGSVVDLSDVGVGVQTRHPLHVGELVTIWGKFLGSDAGRDGHRSARVVHCRVYEGGAFRAGCQYDETSQQSEQSPPAASDFVDHYEILQVSPNASLEMVRRVYRILAPVYHPDNLDSGNAEAFESLLRAYQVLSDPEKRAKYDVKYHEDRTRRWKIFDQAKTAHGVEAEKRKRWGTLSILYAKRLEDGRNPGLRVRELEDLLGCPREHLEFAIWYLRENGLVKPFENARYAITAKGVEVAEETGMWKPQELPPLLEKGKPAEEEIAAGHDQTSSSE